MVYTCIVKKARALATHQERLDDQKELDVDLLAHVTGGTGTKMRKEKDYEKSPEEKAEVINKEKDGKITETEGR